MTRFAILLIFTTFLACQPADNNQRKAPNILFILADDLGYHDLGCMGSNYYQTPNIDKIAQQGMIFTNGYAACQVCSPSRASIMTGKFAARHGITDWIGARVGEDWRNNKRYTRLLPPDYVRHLPHEDVTLAEAFKENGYNTFFAGKWHLGGEGSLPTDHGFDINHGGDHRGGPYAGGFFSPFNNPKMQDYPKEVGMSLPMKLATETSKFIKQQGDNPFLAYLSFYAVHAPIQSSKEKWEKYRLKAHEQGIANSGFRMEERLPIRQYQDNPVYAGLIEHMDDAVGLVLSTLEDQGLAENTIVVFTSDNGGVSSGDNFSTTISPLRGGKGYQWEGGLRVPLLIYVPWMQHNGAKSVIPVTGADFYPTLLELASIEAKNDQHIDGMSFVPVLHNLSLPERSLIWHYPHYGNQGGDPSSIIRKGKWKLIHYLENGIDELYDLSASITEQENVVETYPDVARKLSEELHEYLLSVDARFPSEDPLYSQDSFEMKHNYYINELMPNLEKQRNDFLSESWQPNEDWWGSQVTVD